MSAREQRGSDVWRDSRWRTASFLLFLVCSAGYLLTAPGRIDLVDGAVRFEVADNWLATGKPTISSPGLFSVPGRDGARYSLYPWGASVAGMPFMLLAANLAPGSLEAKQFAFTLTSVPYAAATVALLFMIYGRLGISMRRASCWALVVAFATMLWPYAGSSFDQALQCFWLTLAVWASVEARAHGSLTWALLAAVSFFMLVALQEAYCVLPLGLLAGSRRRSQDLLSRELLIPAIGAAAGGLSLLLYNWWRFGSALSNARFLAPHPIFGNPVMGLAGLFLSPAKSIVLYSPTCILGAVGIVALLPTRPLLSRVVLATCALQLTVISSLAFWAGEWAWGPRYMVATLGLVSIGLPFAWPEKARVTKLVITGAALWVQLLAISVDHQIFYIDRALPAYFWLDPMSAYRDSALWARPGEISRIVSAEGLAKIEALVPNPDPFSMTSVALGLPPEFVNNPRTWKSRYLVFNAPRPWTLWSRLLPVKHRPPGTEALALTSLVVLLVAAAALILTGLNTEKRKDD